MSIKKVKYDAYKLGRREDAFHKSFPAVGDGFIFGNSEANVYDYEAAEGEKIIESDKLIPKIGRCVWIQGRGRNDYVRTSVIEDFYIHGDYENSKDKIVLKAEYAPILEGVVFNDGDILLKTMNSFYVLKVTQNKE